MVLFLNRLLRNNVFAALTNKKLLFVLQYTLNTNPFLGSAKLIEYLASVNIVASSNPSVGPSLRTKLSLQKYCLMQLFFQYFLFIFLYISMNKFLMSPKKIELIYQLRKILHNVVICRKKNIWTIKNPISIYKIFFQSFC